MRTLATGVEVRPPSQGETDSSGERALARQGPGVRVTEIASRGELSCRKRVGSTRGQPPEKRCPRHAEGRPPDRRRQRLDARGQVKQALAHPEVRVLRSSRPAAATS